jgi:diadenosine tetraphosphate (Ap4A) HIT family hydrolase
MNSQGGWTWGVFGTLGLASAIGIYLSRRGSAGKRLGKDIFFADVAIGASHICYASERTVVLKNLHEITPGHMLVIPRRCVTRCSELTVDELADLFATVSLARGGFGGERNEAANLAIKDGASSGQPIPHVHVHVVPRKEKDFNPSDLVYELIDQWSPFEGVVNQSPPFDLPNDDQRFARTAEDMAAEAEGYRKVKTQVPSGPLPDTTPFGKFMIPNGQIFYASPSGLTVALVNLKPLSPGHVLVVPTRAVQMLNDLTPNELTDMWVTARQVQEIVERTHHSRSSNIGLQDGPVAGQSVPHVHVHIIPRL